MATVDGGAYLETEGTPGTPETLLAADAIDYHTLTLTAMSADTERPVVRSTRYGPGDKTPWRTHFEIALETELKHLVPASKTAPPELHDALQAWGWVYDGTNAATGTHVYTLAADPHAAAAAHPCDILKEVRTSGAGLKVQADTCVGGAVLEWPEGAEAIVRASMLGDYNAPTTQGTPLVGVYNAGLPATGLTTATLGAYAALVRSLTLDTQVAAQLRHGGTGLIWPAFLSSPGNPDGEIVIEEVATADYDPFGLWAAGTKATWTFTSVLGTGTITLALAGVQHMKPERTSGEPNTLRCPYQVTTSVTLTWADST